MKKYINNKRRGFTIIETLVAITVLTLAITAPLLIITQALRASYYSRDQITAFYLAQEAIEYIRNVRDETTLDASKFDVDWLEDVTGGTGCAARGTCVNKYDDAVPLYKFNILPNGSGYDFESCSSIDCAPMTYNQAPAGNELPFGGGAADSSIFSRTIWLSTVPGDPKVPDAEDGIPLREVMIHVEIKWRQGTAEHRFVLEDHLLNWKLEQ